MMIKLFTDGVKARKYWEAWGWPGDDEIVLHYGKVGSRGRTRKIAVQPTDPIDELIQRESERWRANGYRELGEAEWVQIVIQYALSTWVSVVDLDKRHKIEDLMNDSLGWTGNGHCDGGDIGSGEMNVFCFVVHPHLAAKTAVRALEQQGLENGAVIAYRDGLDYHVLWPPGVSEFSLA